MDYVGSVGSLDATEIFLGQSFTVVRHWKEMLAKADKKTKVMAVQLKSMKVEVGKTKKLGVELAKIKETMRKLQEDLEKDVSFLSNSLRKERL